MNRAPLTAQELNALPDRIPQWSHVAVDGVDRLQRVFNVPSEAIGRTFTQLLGEMADAAHHHPAIVTRQREVIVAWWTMTSGRISQLDVTMAERTDRLFEAVASGNH